MELARHRTRHSKAARNPAISVEFGELRSSQHVESHAQQDPNNGAPIPGYDQFAARMRLRYTSRMRSIGLPNCVCNVRLLWPDVEQNFAKAVLDDDLL